MTATVVNQWSNSYGQGTTFQGITSALQSCVVGLNATYSVGGGSGTPAAGNWLFCIASWTQVPAIDEVHIGVGDDLRSWWREFPASAISGNTRTAIAYTPNTSGVAGNIYVAPDGQVAAITVLIVEVSGLGPWDTVAAGYPVTNYAAAATALTLTGGAPGAASFLIAGAGGDSTAAGQAFAPAGWTALHTVSQSNGSNQLASSELTCAYLASSSSSQSVSASAGSATDLSGFMLAVWTAGSSPIPAGQNPDWPYMKFEAAFGGGVNSPGSELTWTDLSARLWHWDETTGIQYQLAEIQATNLTIEADNFDGALSPLNVASPYYFAPQALNSNPSFQSGAPPWTATNSATLAVSSAQAFASAFQAQAAQSLRVTPDGTHSLPGAASEKEAVTASTAYTASAWFYSTAGYSAGAEVALTWYTSGGTVISTSTSAAVPLPAATWTQVTLTATSPSGAASAAMTIQEAGTPSATAYYAAEAVFVTGPSAASGGAVSPGTPVRLRAAIGTLGGVTANRWYVIQRTATQWEEKLTETWRRYVEVTCTDLWAALSSTPPTFYRAEIYADSPYAWWPCDDQPGNANVLPTSLRNAALGNTNPLNIVISPSGASAQQYRTTSGENASGRIPPGIGVYTAGADTGWMFGDAPSQAASIASEGGAVTAAPGSAAVQFSGQAGTTGSNGWFLSCNDSSFPPLSGGVTIECWFNAAFYATQTGWTAISSLHPVTGQPEGAPMTIWEIATGSNPVCELQLTSAGHLNLITFSGASGTANSIYTSSDLRSASWHMVTVTLTATTWQAWVNGGATANASGTATGMTPAWTWLILNGDLGANGGSSAGTGLVHGGNMALSHIAVYPFQLPYYRVLDHYWAAVSSFGQLPAPSGVTVTFTPTAGTTESGPAPQSSAYAPDGSSGWLSGTYSASSGVAGSAVVVAAAPGGITSGPSAWATGASVGEPPASPNDAFLWVGWTGLAPSFQVFTASAVGAETQAATVCGSGDSFNSGFGSGASGAGTGQTAAGTGASPPSSASSTGDTVGQRIERLMRAGRTPSPNRCIDPAPLLTVAPGSAGAGTQAGTAVQAIAQSDGGLLYVDNLNNLTYWQRPHLAAQRSSPVWTFTPAAPPVPGAPPSAIPYYEDIAWTEDPQLLCNVIQIEPVSPTGAALPLVTPADTAAVEASQARWGAQPLQISSYLQSPGEQQNQADWLLSQFGQPQRRIQNLKVAAAAYPAAFMLVMGINVGDVATVQDWAIGGTGETYTYRVSQVERRISGGGRPAGGGAEDADQVAEVVLQLAIEPASYWS